MTWGDKPNREKRLNDYIREKLPPPDEDYEVRIMRSDLNSMLATAMREGGEMVARHAHKYRIEIRPEDVKFYAHAVRYEAIRKFVEDK